MISKVAEDSGGITSPEGILMLCVAGILDGIGLIILCFALDDFWILDATGLIVIGGWAFFRSGTIQMTKGAQKIWKRFLISLSVEIIPWLGGLVPCWTWLVFKEMNGRPAKIEGESEEGEGEKANNQTANQKSETTAA